MKIEANDKEIQDIFSLGYFNIPRFQRPYSWSIEEVESFWDDIILEKTENYFIGSMVVYQTKKPYFGIVDGQQRLTTITLILSAIRNSFLKAGEENLAKGIHKYIEKSNINNEDEFVLKAESSFPYLQSHIQSYDGYNIPCEAGSEEKKLELAFEIINRKISAAIPELSDKKSNQPSLFTNHENETIQKLTKFRDKVLSLKLVFIQLDNEDDAYLIFETLNARGRDLTTSDLVKNLILKSIKNNSTSIDQSKESWNALIKVFDSYHDPDVVDNFLVHYWCSKVNYCTDKRLFSEIKSNISDCPIKARDLLKDLTSSALYYSALLQPMDYTWTREEASINLSLRALNLFKVKQQTAMTLALLKSYKEGTLSLRNLTNTIKKIEAFHYCFNTITSQRSSGAIASNYSKLAIELTKAKSNNEIQTTLNKLKQFLISKLPDKKEFLVKFSELEYTSKKTKQKSIVKYTLSELLPKNNNGLPIDLDNLTIEHLISESKINTNTENSIASIGNLILLDQQTNSEDVTNKDPETKFKILKNKNYPLSSMLIDSESWSSKEISLRTHMMAEHIYEKMRSTIMR